MHLTGSLIVCLRDNLCIPIQFLWFCSYIGACMHCCTSLKHLGTNHKTYKKVMKGLSDKDIRKERFQRLFVIGIISFVGALVIWLIPQILIGIPHDACNFLQFFFDDSNQFWGNYTLCRGFFELFFIQFFDSTVRPNANVHF